MRDVQIMSSFVDKRITSVSNKTCCVQILVKSDSVRQYLARSTPESRAGASSGRELNSSGSVKSETCFGVMKDMEESKSMSASLNKIEHQRKRSF